MNSYSEILAADRRLVILRLLNEAPGYSGNDSILLAALQAFGHAPSRDQVRTDLAWLAEQGLITSDDLASVMVVKITSRGADAATGRASVPGVRRPSPK